MLAREKVRETDTYEIQAHPPAFNVSVSLSSSSIVVSWIHDGHVISGWERISRSLTLNMSHFRQNRTQGDNGTAKGSSDKKTSSFDCAMFRIGGKEVVSGFGASGGPVSRWYPARGFFCGYKYVHCRRGDLRTPTSANGIIPNV